MIITSPDPPKRLLDEYDFWFINGQSLLITVDREAGDSIDFDTHPLAVRVSLTSKPSRNEAGVTLTAEDNTIFLKHVLTIQHRQRELTLPTFEQKEEWRKTIQELVSGTIQ